MNGAALQLGQATNQAETEAKTGSARYGPQLSERLKNGIDTVWRNPFAIVLDRDLSVSIQRSHAHANVTVRRRVLRGVVDEICHNLRDTERIRACDDW